MCSKALQSGDKGVLYDAQQSHERTAKTCPLCAIEEFFCLIYQTTFDKVEFQLDKAPGSARTLTLTLDHRCGQDFKAIQLEMIPVKSGNLGRARKVNRLSANTSSLKSIGFLKQSLQYCLKHHHECHQVSNTPPTRLLRIDHQSSSEQGQPGIIYLVDGHTSADRGYLTLSHCWGKARLMELTKDNEVELRAGISAQVLPKTFRDAIYVCEQLEQQYLWIDSLCIRQDDRADWEFESTRMHVVYANAICNIAATGAVDSSVGLFFERIPLAHQPFYIRTGSTGRNKWLCLPDWSVRTVLYSPLNRRSWVVQERFLSNRVMHFTTVGLYWECLQSTASELYPCHAPAIENYGFEEGSMLKASLGKLDTLTPSDHTKFNIYYLWELFVRGYSRCELTKEEDKLVAFNGIAERMKQRLGANLICGLWEHFIIQQLQWEVENLHFERRDAPFVRQWRAPSWSWASGDHHLSSSNFYGIHYACTQRQETAQIAHIEAETAPNGKVASATLILCGNMIFANIRSGKMAYRLREIVWTTVTCANKEYQIDSSAFNFDRLPQLPHEEELMLFALSRCHCKENTLLDGPNNFPVTNRPSLVILLLRQASTNPATYSRAGILRLQGDTCKLWDENVPSATEDIALV